jgi:hypothetical protein
VDIVQHARRSIVSHSIVILQDEPMTLQLILEGQEHVATEWLSDICNEEEEELNQVKKY